MSAPPFPQMGGMRIGVVEEGQYMFGVFLLIGLILLTVYPSHIPDIWLQRFQTVPYQTAGLFLVFSLFLSYGWTHGILAALAFALLISTGRRRKSEGFLPGIGFGAYRVGADCELDGNCPYAGSCPRKHQKATQEGFCGGRGCRCGRGCKCGSCPYLATNFIQPIPKKSNRWFLERVMGENPFLLREEKVSTTAVQDLSERNMGSSYSTSNSK